MDKICQYCKKEILEGENIRFCQYCGTVHHASCWEENEGCSNPGCAQYHAPVKAENGNTCPVCSSPLKEGQAFCTNCGTIIKKDEPLDLDATVIGKPAEKKVCSNCGAALKDGQKFCPNCGMETCFGMDIPKTANPGDPAYPTYPGPPQTPKKKSKVSLFVGIGAGVAVLVGILLVILSSLGGARSVELSADSITVERGGSYSLTYDISPEKASEGKVTWSSDNEDVAEVDSSGTVTARRPGKCTVTVRTDNGKTDSCEVTVEMPEIEKRMVGSFIGTDFLDLNTENSTTCDELGLSMWLRMYDDNTGEIYLGSGDAIGFDWYFSYTNNYGNDVYSTSEDEMLYFIYSNNHDEIWTYLSSGDISYCVTFE